MAKTVRKKNPTKARKIIGVSIHVLLGLAVIYSAWRLFTISDNRVTPEGQSLRQDYILSLLQCLVGFIVMFLPSRLDKRYNIVVPDRIQIMYFVFLYMAIFLGEVHHQISIRQRQIISVKAISAAEVFSVIFPEELQAVHPDNVFLINRVGDRPS